MSDQPDVLIVGGSLVGLSTALFLRLHGVSCLREPFELFADGLTLIREVRVRLSGPRERDHRGRAERKLRPIAKVAHRAWG